MNMIENDYHFLLVCPFYQDRRRNRFWSNTHKGVA